MKHIICMGLFALSLFTVKSHGHDEAESRVALEADLSGSTAADKITFRFDLVDTKVNKLVLDTDLEVMHEMLLHLVVYDSTLNEFQHIHPIFKDSRWLAEMTLSVNGEYWIWAQGILKSDGEEFSSSSRLTIAGGSKAWPAMPLKESRHGESGISIVDLGADKIMAGSMVMLKLVMSRNDKTTPELTPYLGAFAHVIAVPEDGDALIHVHPMDGDKPNEGMLHATFSAPGLYRVWIQFIDGGDLKTIPLSVEVF